jgi:hypothetical protein
MRDPAGPDRRPTYGRHCGDRPKVCSRWQKHRFWTHVIAHGHAVVGHIQRNKPQQCPGFIARRLSLTATLVIRISAYERLSGSVRLQRAGGLIARQITAKSAGVENRVQKMPKPFARQADSGGRPIHGPNNRIFQGGPLGVDFYDVLHKTKLFRLFGTKNGGSSCVTIKFRQTLGRNASVGFNDLSRDFDVVLQSLGCL